MQNLIRLTFIFLIFLISNEGLAQQGLIGSGFTYHPIAKAKGINLRFGVGNAKTSIVFEYNYFFAGKAINLNQIGANLNLKKSFSEKVKGKLMGGVFLMGYKSRKITSSTFPFSSTDSSDNFLGGNIGVGMDISLSKNLMFFAEGKYIG